MWCRGRAHQVLPFRGLSLISSMGGFKWGKAVRGSKNLKRLRVEWVSNGQVVHWNLHRAGPCRVIHPSFENEMGQKLALRMQRADRIWS